jgi:hypothetical protein
MELREALQKRIEKRQAEVAANTENYENYMRTSAAYIQALQDTLKLIPESGESASQEVSLRFGSNVAKARDALRQAGRPLHITEILKAIGMAADKKNKLALGGSISAYARKKKIFTKTESNTFGLLEFQNGTVELKLEDDLRILQAEQKEPAIK